MTTEQATRDWTGFDHVGAIIEYEGGNPTAGEVVKLFQYLVDTGMAWSLQGHYGRQAKALIENGLVSAKGDQEPSRKLTDEQAEAHIYE